MSLTERLREKAEQQKSKGNFLNLKDIPNEIKLKWLKDEFKNDARGKECMYVTMQTETSQTVVQKFTSTAYSDLADSVEKAGGLDVLKGNFALYEKRKSGRAIFDRLFPIAKTSKKQK